MNRKTFVIASLTLLIPSTIAFGNQRLEVSHAQLCEKDTYAERNKKRNEYCDSHKTNPLLERVCGAVFYRGASRGQNDEILFNCNTGHDKHMEAYGYLHNGIAVQIDAVRKQMEKEKFAEVYKEGRSGKKVPMNDFQKMLITAAKLCSPGVVHAIRNLAGEKLEANVVRYSTYTRPFQSKASHVENKTPITVEAYAKDQMVRSNTDLQKGVLVQSQKNCRLTADALTRPVGSKITDSWIKKFSNYFASTERSALRKSVVNSLSKGEMGGHYAEVIEQGSKEAKTSSRASGLDN